jgi:hypothetical protein
VPQLVDNVMMRGPGGFGRIQYDSDTHCQSCVYS